MSDFATCFDDRKVEDSIWGERLSGTAITIDWLGDNTGLGYYTLISFYFMVGFIIWGFWRENLNQLKRTRVAILLWKLSIFFFALTAAICGVTKFTLFMGVAHNATEANLLIILISALYTKISKLQKRILYVVLSAYILGELLGTVVPSMLTGWYFLGVMGGILDLVCFIAFVVSGVKNKQRWWEVTGSALHLTYVVTFLSNCFFLPWGRIIGLGLNVFAVGFASVPMPKNIYKRKENEASEEQPTEDMSSEMEDLDSLE